MKLSMIERISYVWVLFFLGIVMTAIGLFAGLKHPENLQGTIMISCGLILISSFCVASLLTKLIEKQ